MSTAEEEKQVAEDEEEEEEEEDLEKLEAEIARMEAEAAAMESDKKEEGESGTAKLSADEKVAQDAKSIYVGQVDYSATPEELVAHFKACGQVERVTIMCDRFTGHPKGFAYIEFESEDSVENALKLDGSDFKGRQLKVTKKRVNQPGMAVRGGRGGRGRGVRGRGPPGRGFRGRGRSRGGYRGGYRGGGRGGGYHPY